MTKRIYESATIAYDKKKKALRVVLITEGSGSSSDFGREFFTQENADLLAGSLSFPGHPEDLERPEYRDPMGAIGSIGDVIDVEEVDGLMQMSGDYLPSKSKPQVAEYLNEYASKLALSIYSDSEGRADPSTGKWIAESLTPIDPFRSVDLVVAAGRGGKFEKQLAESLRQLTEASATAGEKEVTHMDKDIELRFDGLTKIVEGLVSTLEGKAKAGLQVEADTTAVEKAVEGRLSDYDKAVGLISEAKVTESQSASLRALALTGVDVAPAIEDAKKVLAEALASKEDDDKDGKIAEHLGGGTDKTDTGFDVPNFGKVS